MRHEFSLDLLDAGAHSVCLLAEVLVLIVRRRVRGDGALVAALRRRRVALTRGLRARHVVLGLGQRVRQAGLHASTRYSYGVSINNNVVKALWQCATRTTYTARRMEINMPRGAAQ